LTDCIRCSTAQQLNISSKRACYIP